MLLTYPNFFFIISSFMVFCLMGTSTALLYACRNWLALTLQSSATLHLSAMKAAKVSFSPPGSCQMLLPLLLALHPSPSHTMHELQIRLELSPLIWTSPGSGLNHASCCRTRYLMQSTSYRTFKRPSSTKWRNKAAFSCRRLAWKTKFLVSC